MAESRPRRMRAATISQRPSRPPPSALSDTVFLGKGESMHGDAERTRLSSTFEALIGAITAADWRRVGS